MNIIQHSRCYSTKVMIRIKLNIKYSRWTNCTTLIPTKHTNQLICLANINNCTFLSCFYISSQYHHIRFLQAYEIENMSANSWDHVNPGFDNFAYSFIFNYIFLFMYYETWKISPTCLSLRNHCHCFISSSNINKQTVGNRISRMHRNIYANPTWVNNRSVNETPKVCGAASWSVNETPKVCGAASWSAENRLQMLVRFVTCSSNGMSINRMDKDEISGSKLNTMWIKQMLKLLVQLHRQKT